MINLTEELATGPLATEIIPYIASNNFEAILNCFNRKDIPVKGKLTVHDVKQYVSLLGLRIVFLESDSLACKEFNLALNDFAMSGFDLFIPPIYDKICAVLDAIVAESTIPQFTEENKWTLLSFGNKLLSRAEQLGLELTIDDITNALYDSIGNRKF